MTDKTGLPPGQYELDEFPRFGLPQFAFRFPKETRQIQLTLSGDVGEHHGVERASQSSARRSDIRLPLRDDVDSAFTPMERLSIRGVLRTNRCAPSPSATDATFAVLRCQDGYAASLPLADLLADSVLLADTLNGEPLTMAHGAPLRLVAPAHYGYKNAKHISGVEFWRDDRRRYRSAAFRFMVHPRARVAFEERGRGVPGWILRYLYRPLAGPAIRQFRRALDQHLDARP